MCFQKIANTLETIITACIKVSLKPVKVSFFICNLINLGNEIFRNSLGICATWREVYHFNASASAMFDIFVEDVSQTSGEVITVLAIQTLENNQIFKDFVLSKNSVWYSVGFKVNQGFNIASLNGAGWSKLSVEPGIKVKASLESGFTLNDFFNCASHDWEVTIADSWYIGNCNTS